MKNEVRIGGSAAVLLLATMEKEQRLNAELDNVRRAISEMVAGWCREEGHDAPREFGLTATADAIVVAWEADGAEGRNAETAPPS